MKILIIDNYDSFTYNLYQNVGEILEERVKNFELDVYRNDEISVEKAALYDRIILSPGPGDPSDRAYFGVCADVLLQLSKKIPTLGVCLGMQGVAHYFGGKVVRVKKPMHGKTSLIQHDSRGVFANLPQEIEVMRYHSLVVEQESLAACLEISARTYGADGSFEIMGLRHKAFPLEGVQFHPESFATEGGKTMLENFLFQS